MIAVYNPANTTVPTLASILVATTATQSQQITIDRDYSNVVLQGNYFYYQLVPGNSQGYGYM